MKVKIYDKYLLLSTGSFASIIGSGLSVVAIFYNGFIYDNRKIVIITGLVSILMFYLIKLNNMNKMRKISLSIHESTFEIKSGNIFEDKNLKVINFNEYFDTKVDDKIIAKNSLNGEYIVHKMNNEIEYIDKEIEKQLEGKEQEVNNNRNFGKNKKYSLGEIVAIDDYLLTSLTKFTNENRAVLTLKEYMTFLMNFWDNLDKIYANRSVTITLFGSSSLTRFTDAYEIRDQDLIEIIIWTFKISKIKFKYPSKITMVLSDNMINKINLYKIREMYKNGL